MPWADFWIILAITAACTLLSRVLPVALFAGRELPALLLQALEYIPVAAFAALVANDLFNPTVFSAGPVRVLIPLIALIPVIVVARKSRSLGLCIVTGVAAYALLQWLAGLAGLLCYN